MDFRQLVQQLDERGLLVRVKRPVDRDLEVSTVVRMLKGRPVLFENVKGSAIPVVSNVCASRALVGLALGVGSKDIVPHLSRAIDNPVAPRLVSAADYEELPPDLNLLPILRYYREDGGRYIASGVAIARDPEHGLNASYHRAMVMGPDLMAIRLVERHLHEFKKRGLKEFAFCVGNPTTVMIGGAISTDIGRSELAMANAMSDTPVIELGGHVVPRSEIVLVLQFTGEEAAEGPFLDLTETFDIVRQQPVVRVKRIFARKGALFHALLPGDLEHKVLMGMPREPTIFREVSRVCECLDVHVSPGGCSWLHGVVKIRKRSEEDGRKAIEAAFKGHASMKHVTVVDHDIDIEDSAEVEWAMATRFQGHRGLHTYLRQKGSSLDPSSDMATKETTKVGFDCTAPLAATGKDFSRPGLPLELNMADYLDR